MDQTPDTQRSYSAASPYPPIKVLGANRAYAGAMLDNIGGCNSEMSAVSLYTYNNMISRENADIAKCFHKISIVEMHHLDIFGQLALLLGENPRLWTIKNNKKVYWSPSYNSYPIKLNELLTHAISQERDAICKYQKQIREIQDPNITALLNRIILDEEKHIEIFKELYKEYT